MSRHLPRSGSLLAVAVTAALFLACAGDEVPQAGSATRDAATAPQDDATHAAGSKSPKKEGPRRVDPRKGGFEIGLGEWALAPEADAIRPGTVTFVIHNRGTVQHGFEIALEGDSSGSGSGDLFKAESELLDPGESTRMTLDLGPGIYEIECLVDGHDDMGMEDVLEVRRSAPLVRSPVDRASNENEVAIADFAFAPNKIVVGVGTEVSWHNHDPTDHTVTSLDGTFGSDALPEGADFSHRFATPGTFAYRCAIHPEMKGKVTVE